MPAAQRCVPLGQPPLAHPRWMSGKESQERRFRAQPLQHRTQPPQPRRTVQPSSLVLSARNRRARRRAAAWGGARVPDRVHVPDRGDYVVADRIGTVQASRTLPVAGHRISVVLREPFVPSNCLEPPQMQWELSRKSEAAELDNQGKLDGRCRAFQAESSYEDPV